jgi:hypothetical protein
MDTIPGWQQLWCSLESTEQEAAVEAFLTHLESRINRELTEIAWERIAAAYNFRPEFVARMSSEKRRAYFTRRIDQILFPALWHTFLSGYFRLHWTDLVNKVYQLFQIEQTEEGVEDGEIVLPADEKIRMIVADLEEEFSPRQLAAWFNCLILSDEAWAPLKPEYARLMYRASGERERAITIQTPRRSVESRLPDDEKPLYAEFTTLDKVLIDHVIATISGEEGALTVDQLGDLIDTVVSLNAKRHRSYFHMGFMDALVPDQTVSLNRPEFNDLRKEWYLAGALAGFARQRDKEKLVEALKKHASTFSGAAAKRGGPGTVMAKLLFNFLIDSDRIAEAKELLAGQVVERGFELAFVALERATNFIRARNPASAMPLLTVLQDSLPELDQQSENLPELSSMVLRLLGQCLQVQGNFDRARQMFQELYDSGIAAGFHELSGDLGLVQGNFRSLYEVRIPTGTDAQFALIEGLERGREYFNAPEQDKSKIPVNCTYPLAVLVYLQYMNAPDDTARDKLRDSALQQVQMAITSIQGSPLASVFEKEGILGQTLFMQAILQMDRLEHDDARAALAAWNRITEVAGEFPLDHVKRLLTTAEAVDPDIARQLAESIWTFRHVDATSLILETDVLRHSSSLRRQIAEAAANPGLPRAERWRIWSRLVPICIATNDLQEAADGLRAGPGF